MPPAPKTADGVPLGKSQHLSPDDPNLAGGVYSRFNKLNDTPEGMHDIVVHGSPDGFARDSAFRQPVSPATLAEEAALAGRVDEPVRLVSCEAACGPAAQELADALGAPVLAADDLVWITQSGNVVAGPKPNIPTGNWTWFMPQA